MRTAMRLLAFPVLERLYNEEDIFTAVVSTHACRHGFACFGCG